MTLFIDDFNSGSGYSRWGDLDLTKWVEDPVKDAVGSFYYIRNVYKNKVWSHISSMPG